MHGTTHSVMFHHFHDDQHPRTQGSLSSSEFIRMIDWLNKHYSILNASQYKEGLENSTLKNNDICLSFDDALKCQYDVALPALESLGIQAFFFVYSSAFGENPDPLEIYRYFRTVCYPDIGTFYNDFFRAVEQMNRRKFSRSKTKYAQLDYLSACPFYTENDKWFRYLRDQYLLEHEYDEVMQGLMATHDFNANSVKGNLWMSEADLSALDNGGHVIGLHSYSHPTRMSQLSRAEQESEYQYNYDHLVDLLGKPIKAMSHPCGDYNQQTLQILEGMGIEIGFRSNMSVREIHSPLEVPREDHANVLKEMSL